MSSMRNYKDELIKQSKKDKASKLMINKKFIENIDKVNRGVKCIFICKCAVMGKKNIRQILGDTNKNNGTGLFCKNCTKLNSNTKIGYKNRDIFDILDIYFKWWLIKKGIRYSNRKKTSWNKDDLLNICNIEYHRKINGEKQGVNALIPKNLNNLPGCNVFDRISQIKKEENYKEEFKLSIRGNQNQKTPGYPDIYICELLGLVNERKEYLKNTFPCETDTFEEMCEIHIRPFLENYIKNIDVNGFILTEHIFYNNNKCNIRSGLKKHKKGINELRQYFKLNKDNLESLRKDSEGYYERRNSKAEIVFDNFLVLYTDLNNENVKWEEPYPQDFVEKYGKKCLMDCTITINEKIIIVEIWNFGPNDMKYTGEYKNRYDNYIKWRKIKEDYWKTKNDIIFIGIDQDKLYSNQCESTSVTFCKQILSPHIDILDVTNKIGCNVFPKNDYDLMMEECNKYFIKNNNKLYDDLPNKILKIIKRTYGNITNGLYELRKILHTEINDICWKESYTAYKSHEELQKIKDKKKQTHNNKTPEEKKLISTKISNSHNNFSAEKKAKIKEKQTKTMKENLHSKGVNNPMFGKKGKDNPNYGSKQPRHTKEEYETMYAPLICKFLQSLNDGDKINPSSDKWRNYCKPTIMPYTPWNNKPDYNPWYETKWIGFIETGIKYAEQNNITLPNFYYKNVVSSDKKNKKKNYEEEDVWNIHINFIKYCDKNNIDKTKKNADKFFRDKNFIMKLDTLISKNNKNSEIFGTSYTGFLKLTLLRIN